MHLENIRLTNFKNTSTTSYSFSKKINCFVGKNGVGKTNTLDAIHYLALTKSYLNKTDGINIKFGETFFSIEGNFFAEDKEENIKLLVQAEQKKVLKRNNKAYTKLSEHIGKFPCVMISPYDQNLISEGSEFRRKFIDGMISQIDAEYMHSLIRYQKTVQQRNSLLKSFHSSGSFDALSLEMYNVELIKHGEIIYKRRLNFIEKYIPLFKRYYKLISNSNEDIDIKYESDMHSSAMTDLLKENIKRDRDAGLTTKGVHKDDLSFELLGYPIKKVGSQGQQKSFLIALKLAQMDIIKEYSQINPILLLDDIFDKLDEDRVAQLVQLVHDEDFGQIFLSDTHQERTKNIVEQISPDYKIFEI